MIFPENRLPLFGITLGSTFLADEDYADHNLKHAKPRARLWLNVAIITERMESGVIWA
jgi:hypothetical protein